MTVVKCVVWDLDDTVWRGVAIETRDRSAPPVDPAVLHALDVLEQRGIVNSVASRTDPSLRPVLDAHPQLGGRFVAPQLSWAHKSGAITAIAAELGIATDAVVFVDDSAFERAQVAADLPEVRVFSPAEFLSRLDTPELRPEVVTDDARSRPRRYREEAARRAAARDFTGRTEAFLHDSDIRLELRAAQEPDIDRVVELIARTHRLNTTGEEWSPEQVHRVVADPGWFVPVARLSDRFGDYGLIGAALVDRTAAQDWRLRLFTVSCRAAGRDVPGAFLSRVLAAARAAGVGWLTCDLRPSEANLELRVLLRAAGFVPAPEPAADSLLALRRRTDADLNPPSWLTITEGFDRA
ncbi:hypothetical protein [Plantactinospora sp. CA-290183]|uniref:hypothetical protein n=1 Tax=Plantactinospora sp. CA-290183 TaxID=3240006 RepID=UPI003D8B34EE